MHVGHLLTSAAQRYPSRTAWMQGDTYISFAEAEDRVNRLANVLLSLGGQAGDRVGMLMNNCYEGIETILAPMKVGMAVVPMNARLHPKEHEYLLNNSGATTLVYGKEYQNHISEIRGDLETVQHFICVGDGAGGDMAYEHSLGSASALLQETAIDPDDLAWLFYTSGTTGVPKGAMLTHRNLLTMAESFSTEINPAVCDDVLLHGAPITHGSGLTMFHHISCGAANAFSDASGFDPSRVFAAIERYRATTMFMAPTMINRLVASQERNNYDSSSLHTVVYGGAPMYKEHLLEALSVFGDIFVQIFGQGEAPMALTFLPKKEHQHGGNPFLLQRLSSAGREVTGVCLRVVDEQDCIVATGEVGEIIAKSDLVMKGYWNNIEATSETLRGGWLHTGDLGYLDSTGYLYITDRKNDMIISGGANIYPREVEEVIARHHAVAEVVVFGVPDTNWGEGVKALVVLHEGKQAKADEIISFCRDNIASYKKPQSIEFLEALPKNAYGKVARRELRDGYWKDQERKV